MPDVALGVADYLLGVVELSLIAGAAGWGGSALRRLWLPGWTGAPAWLATAVLALALALLTAEILGTIGAFTDLPFIVALIAVAFGLTLIGRRRPAAAAAAPPTPDQGRGATLAAVLVAAVVVAHFSIETRISLAEGMSGFDTTWYHGTFAALFAQDGSTWGLNFIAPQYLSWFYPQNSELLHAAGILAFDRDILSPLFGMGWLAGSLGAAWCIGRPYGAGPVAMAGAALVLGSGALADQSGEARNDLPAIFFCLAAAAIVVNGAATASSRDGRDGAGPARPPLDRGVLIVAGVAAGLAAGTKVNYLAAGGALVVGLAAVAPAGTRLRALAAAGIPAFIAGGYWYVRNLLHAGSPLPWVKGTPLAAPAQPLGGREEHGVVDYATDTGVWSDWFGPGLHDALGFLWPLVLLAAGAGVVLSLTGKGSLALRALAVVVLVTAAAWAVAPASAEGPQGSPVGFISGLRYLAPALALGLALLAVAPALRDASRRTALLGAFVVLLPFVDASSGPWYGSYVAGAAAVGILAALGACAALLDGARRAARPVLLSVAAAAAGVTLVAGYLVQRDYLRGRYAEPTFADAGLNDAFAWARDVREARIGVVATRQYPFFGADLSNEVHFVGVEEAHGGFVRAGSCPEWRRAVNEGDYDYLVTSLDRVPQRGPRFPAEAGWTAGAPGVSEVLRRAPVVVFRIEGPLPPAGCRSQT